MTEYQIIKLFQPFGKIESVDYLWHKDGPMIGKPRNFCFIRFSTVTEAQNAIDKMHSKCVGGRKLCVGYKSPGKDPDLAYFDRMIVEKRQLTSNAITAEHQSSIKLCSARGAIESKLAELRNVRGSGSPADIDNTAALDIEQPIVARQSNMAKKPRFNQRKNNY